MRSDDIVPFAVKPVAVEIDPLQVVFGHFAAGDIFAAIQAARDGQAFGGRRLGNELDDGFVVPQGFAPPIRRDEGKEAVFDLVLRHRLTAAAMCRNCASRSGWSRPSSVFRLLWRL